MQAFRLFAASPLLAFAMAASAQQPGQPELKIDSSNRTLSVNSQEQVTVEPDVAILHIGFETQVGDAQGVYADGARTSNAIVGALKQANIPESSIRSEMQRLDRDFTKPHKFKLVQEWTVRTPPERAAEILDIAITAGATSSGDIDWTVKDERALEEQALDRAAARAKENASVLAKGMGVRLGALVYVSNQVSAPNFPRPVMRAFAMDKNAAAAPALAIEPHKVSREASVYAVYSIE
ncbi:MAG TPA: SIMPL domain-containing protein [Terracidiphilus sp.]|jgi:hypothetical protein